MADAVFYEGDRRPFFRVTLLRGGEPISLENATGVTLKMWRDGREILAPVVTGSCSIIQVGTTTDVGVVEYEWADGDLNLYGLLSAVFIIEWPTTLPETVPDTGYISVLVRPSGVAAP